MSVCAIRPLLNGAWSPSSMSGMSWCSATVTPRPRPRRRRARAERRSARPRAPRAGPRWRRGRRSSATGSLSQKTSSRPAAAAPSATTSTAAALISVRNTSASAAARCDRRRQPPPVGEVARDEHDLGAVVRGERRRQLRRRGLGRRGEEGDAAAADGLHRPRPEHRRHDLEAGPDAPGGGGERGHLARRRERRLALRQDEGVAEQQPVRAEEAGDVVGRLARPGDAQRRVREHRRHHGAAALDHGQRGAAPLEQRQRLAHVVVERHAGEAAAAAPAADRGHAGEHRVLVAVAGGVPPGAGGGEQLGGAEPVAAADELRLGRAAAPHREDHDAAVRPPGGVEPPRQPAAHGGLADALAGADHAPARAWPRSRANACGRTSVSAAT